MTTIVVETNASTWMIATEIAGHSLFFIQAGWWFTIDQFNAAVALFQMALFSLFYHLCVLDVAPDPSHVAFFHGLDYTGIFGLTNMLFFEIIMLPVQFAFPLWVLMQTFAILGNWILYNTGFLLFGALLSYAVIFGVAVLHRQHTDEKELPWLYSLKYWYVLLIGIILLMGAVTLLFIGGNPGDHQYEPVHGGAWHFAANPPLAVIMCFIVLQRKNDWHALKPFFFVFKKKEKKI